MALALALRFALAPATLARRIFVLGHAVHGPTFAFSAAMEFQ